MPAKVLGHRCGTQFAKSLALSLRARSHALLHAGANAVQNLVRGGVIGASGFLDLLLSLIEQHAAAKRVFLKKLLHEIGLRLRYQGGELKAIEHKMGGGNTLADLRVPEASSLAGKDGGVLQGKGVSNFIHQAHALGAVV